MKWKGRGVVAFLLFVYVCVYVCMCVYDDLSTYLTKAPKRVELSVIFFLSPFPPLLSRSSYPSSPSPSSFLLTYQYI